MDTELLIALTIFAFVSCITPGPNNIMIMTSGLNFGIYRSLPHLLGIFIGFPVMVLTIGLGMGTFFELFPSVHRIIKFLGVLYMAWLAWKTAFAATSQKASQQKSPLGFIAVFLFQWANPKAWVMATGAIATFATIGGTFYSDLVNIVMIYIVVGVPSVWAWLYFGVWLQRVLQSEHSYKRFNQGMGVLLFLSIVPIIIQLIEESL